MSGYALRPTSMIDSPTSPEAASPRLVATQPSLWRLIARHKAASLAVLALLVAFVAVLVPEVVGAGSWKVSDATACSTWGAANQGQQAAYARLYVREHGPLSNGATSASSIVTAINNGCTAAYGYDEADSVNVLQAIKGRY
jgi:hypothetical protein